VEVRIHIPRPILTLGSVTIILLWWCGILAFNLGKNPQGNALGGQPASAVITGANQDIDRERIRQAVLAQREEILRYQVQLLEHEALATKDPESIASVNEARKTLLAIIAERDASEKLLRISLEQLWEAEGSAFTLRGINIAVKLFWPVSPRLGISATFADEDYQKRFGVPHHAIDIPVPEGTEIQAPADGVVSKVSLNGLGYSYLVLDHGNGVETVYGHISEALVEEGATVHAGDAIAKSGGQPGTEGAGLLTTGPHLHFAVKVNGVLVDPLKYLPKI
jgi:murein DD-endopeptidase MepM/ murein hydrolase activator NlpD